MYGNQLVFVVMTENNAAYSFDSQFIYSYVLHRLIALCVMILDSEEFGEFVFTEHKV